MVIAPSQAATPLANLSVLHQELIAALNAADTPEEQETIITEALANQEAQASLVDFLAYLGQALEAERTALEAQKAYYVETLGQAIGKVAGWQASLDKAVLTAHNQGNLPKKMIGNSGYVEVKLNPASCQVEVHAEELPQEYQRVKVEANKDAIKAAWKDGIEVPGTRVERKQRVLYKPTLPSFGGMVAKSERSRKRQQKQSQ